MIVSYSTHALIDIQGIYDYIAERNPVAAVGVAKTIELSIRRLADFPLSGRMGAVPGTRELVVTRLPYMAVYRLIAERVEVIAVFHASQDKPRGA